MPITIIHCWSAPRSRSTALLYSFESRGDDTIGLDEPLYRRWLLEKMSTNSGGEYAISRPYAESLLNGVSPDGDDDVDGAWRWEREKPCFDERVYNAVKSLVENGKEDGCVFIKQMAKFSHLFDFDDNCETLIVDGSGNGDASTKKFRAGMKVLLDGGHIQHRHLLLIRDPMHVLSSFFGKSGNVHGNNPHPDEVGITQLMDVYSKIVGSSMKRGCGAEEKNTHVVIDSDDLAAHPQETLQHVCAEFGMEFIDSMLTWKSGPHICDGPWAKWWYHDVWESCGWDMNEDDARNHPRTQKYRTVPTALLPILRMSIPAYNFFKTLTSAYQHRAISTPISGKLYEDPRNEHIFVFVGAKGKGQIIPRDMAIISPFDSSVQGGDATWEGIRVYNDKVWHLDAHLDRLFRSAKALGFINVHTRTEVIDSIFQVLAANGMRDGAHMRLTLTRGEKCTSSMNPVFNVYGTTLIILPEWKPTEGATTYDNTRGIALITAANRRSPPSTLDNKIHHNNLIQNILPKIQANLAGVADAIMLDTEGYVAETNATNLFMVRYEGVNEECSQYLSALGVEEYDANANVILITPSGDHCLPGITRNTVLLLAKELGIKTEERRVSLSEFYCADEVFTTGTMGELTPVTLIDGRVIGKEGKRGQVTELLQRTYKDAVATRDDWYTDLPPFA